MLHKRIDWIDADPCSKGLPRWVYERTNLNVLDKVEGVPEEEENNKFCCCPGDTECSQTTAITITKGKTFSIGVSAGGDGGNLAKAATDAARTIGSSMGFDFSYSWSETFSSLESNTCGLKQGFTVPVSQTQQTPCHQLTFYPLVRRTTWTQKKKNICDPNSEWEEGASSADEPLLNSNKRRIGTWLCLDAPPRDYQICTNEATYSAGEGPKTSAPASQTTVYVPITTAPSSTAA